MHCSEKMAFWGYELFTADRMKAKIQRQKGLLRNYCSIYPYQVIKIVRLSFHQLHQLLNESGWVSSYNPNIWNHFFLVFYDLKFNFNVLFIFQNQYSDLGTSSWPKSYNALQARSWIHPRSSQFFRSFIFWNMNKAKLF